MWNVIAFAFFAFGVGANSMEIFAKLRKGDGGGVVNCALWILVSLLGAVMLAYMISAEICEYVEPIKLLVVKVHQ